jgi:hypothetical protein
LLEHWMLPYKLIGFDIQSRAQDHSRNYVGQLPIRPPTQ